jgi:integrase
MKLTQRLVNGLKPKARKYDVNDSEMRGFCVRVMPSGTMMFYLRFWAAGKQKWFKLADARGVSVEQARAVARKTLADVAHGVDPQEKKRAGRGHTLRTFIDQDFQPWALANRKSGRDTVARLKSRFAKLLDVKLTDITAWRVEKLRAAWVKKTELKGTGNRDIACIKGMFSRAVEWGHLAENPLRSVRLAKTDAVAKIRIIDPMEETRLWGALDARETARRQERARYNAWCRARALPELPDLNAVAFTHYLKPLLTILLHTGARRGEAFSLEWRDVDFAKRVMTVRGETAKSGKTRVIPLNAVALSTLTEWRKQSPKDNPLVFPSPVTGGRLSHINVAWRNLTAAAEIKGLRTHDLRHTFASRCLARGADINTVRELLGHSDIKTTAIYLHSTAQDKAAAVERLTANVIPFARTAEI